MELTFHGVRGSTPCHGDEIARYGGNTSCVSLDIPGHDPILFDLGTGLRYFGLTQPADEPFRGTCLLSHLHWDHIQGLPFFVPAYVPGNRIDVISGPSGAMPLEAALRRQMTAPFFPVEFDEIAPQVRTRDVRARDRFSVGDIRVTVARLNHPDPVYGYRLDAGGRSVVYATDTEHFACVDPALRQLADGADVLIYDAQYTPEEYPGKVGWGHSTWTAGAELARAANVGQLVLFHHDPRRTDTQLAELEARAAAACPGTIAAREGVVLHAGERARGVAA